MAFQPHAGEMKHRLMFQKRTAVTDDYGNERADFVTEFTTSAALMVPGFGSEAAQSARLEGRQPVTIRVHRNSQTVQIQADWRAVDTRNAGIIYALTAPPVDREQRGIWLEMSATIGAPA